MKKPKRKELTAKEISDLIYEAPKGPAKHDIFDIDYYDVIGVDDWDEE